MMAAFSSSHVDLTSTVVPDASLLCDLLWTDPGHDATGWATNDRGLSLTLGADKVSEFLTA